MSAKRPDKFPLEKTRTHKSLGVHSPHPLRDDPSHPHASLGEDRLKVTFADGGVIGETESYHDGGQVGVDPYAGLSPYGQVAAMAKKARNAQPTGTPKLGRRMAPPVPQGGVPRRNAMRGWGQEQPSAMPAFKDGGMIDMGRGVAASPEKASQIITERRRNKATRDHNQEHPTKIERSASRRFLFGEDRGYKTTSVDTPEQKEEHIRKRMADSKRKKPAANQK